MPTRPQAIVGNHAPLALACAFLVHSVAYAQTEGNSAAANPPHTARSSTSDERLAEAVEYDRYNKNYAYVASNYRSLSAKAERGDRTASAMLFYALVDCDTEKQVTTSQKTREGGGSPLVEGVAKKAALRCDHFSQEQAERWPHWLELAVSSEDDEVLSQYYLRRNDLAPTSDPGARSAYTTNLMDILDAAVATRKSPAAARWLADIFERGELVPRDEAVAYCYMHSFVTLKTSQDPEWNATSAKNHLTRMKSSIAPDIALLKERADVESCKDRRP